MAVLDGVFIEKDGEIVFHKLPAPKTEDVKELVHRIREGVLRLLARRQISLGRDGDEFEDPLVEESPALASVSAASVYGLTAIGSRAGCRLRRLGEEPEVAAEKPKRKRHARYRGFDLHAGAPVKAGERERLERLLRYLLRPAVAEFPRAGSARAGMDPPGDVTPAAIPAERARPRVSAGPGEPSSAAFSPVGALRPPRPDLPGRRGEPNTLLLSSFSHRRGGGLVRAEDPSAASGNSGAEFEVAKGFGFDVLACPKCSGRLKLIALIDQPAVIEKILSHLGLPTEPPRARPARPPPEEPEQLDLPESFDDPP
jgi:hypothetical protein